MINHNTNNVETTISCDTAIVDTVTPVLNTETNCIENIFSNTNITKTITNKNINVVVNAALCEKAYALLSAALIYEDDIMDAAKKCKANKKKKKNQHTNGYIETEKNSTKNVENKVNERSPNSSDSQVSYNKIYVSKATGSSAL